MSDTTTNDEIHECPEGEVWSAEQQRCVPKPTEPAEGAEKGSLEQRIFSAMEAIMTAKCAETEQQILKNVDTIMDLKARTVDATLRKGFGVSSDRVLHMSDLIAYGRKAALDTADTGKRTPAIAKGGPDGTMKPDPIQKLFRDARQGVSSDPS